METWRDRAACSREGKGENRDGKGQVKSWNGLEPPGLGRKQHGGKSPIPPLPRVCTAIPQRVHGGDAAGGIGIVRRQQEREIVRFHDLNRESSYLVVDRVMFKLWLQNKTSTSLYVSISNRAWFFNSRIRTTEGGRTAWSGGKLQH